MSAGAGASFNSGAATPVASVGGRASQAGLSAGRGRCVDDEGTASTSGDRSGARRLSAHALGGCSYN